MPLNEKLRWFIHAVKLDQNVFLLLLLPIPVDDNDDDLARLEARFDPEYASFKNQLDALFKHNKISTN